MADICYPPTTDWSCRWTEAELLQAQADPVMAPKIERAEAFAWSLLAALTAYRIGTCPITVRPCAARCAPGGSYVMAPASGRLSGVLAPLTIGLPHPYISGGVWYNACGCGGGDCSCDSLSEVALPGPVGSIVSVKIDGEVLDRDQYAVLNGSRLVRLDGESWPLCQDMTASDDEGFSVTYFRGPKPNILTNAAAGVLANEFLLACDRDGSCRLPNNVTSFTTGGASYSMEEVDAENGFSIPEVEAVIRIYNPYGLKAEPIVASPDMYDTPVKTWR